MTDESALDRLKEHYGHAARNAAKGPAAVQSCDASGGACSGPLMRDSAETVGSGLYGPDELALIPDAAIAGSIGCANPVALADLRPGEDVLDLGSGGGLDVLLSARRVGPEGRAYGVDMTPEMLELARSNQATAGVTNAEFLEGTIEAVPLPDETVDVVLSNCVITLSADKEAVFREAHRVLRAGGRLAIADVISDGPCPSGITTTDAAWAQCATRAVTRDEYRAQLAAAGFAGVEITDSHEVAEGFWSVLVRAIKPAA